MSVKCEEKYFKSSCGNVNVRYLIWENPCVPVKGIYLIAHGVCEHIDRFDGLARSLAEKGFAIYGEDHLGHGKTAPSKKYIGQLPGQADQHIVDDMHILYNIAIENHPNVPVFMLGHSMGSFVAKIYSAKYGDTLDGVVYCGSGDYTDGLKYLVNPLSVIFNIIGRDKSWLVENNMFTTAWLSRDRENRRLYLEDEYITKYYSLGLMETLGKLAADCSGLRWAKQVPKDLPIFIISGTEDIVGFCTLGVNLMELFLKKTGHEKVDKKFYFPYRHEILREKRIREKVWGDVYNWTMKNWPLN